MSRHEFTIRYQWMMRGRVAIPDSWLQLLVPVCELVNQIIPHDRRTDFQMDVHCDRGDYPLKIDVLREPAGIDMTEIERAIDEVEGSTGGF